MSVRLDELVENKTTELKVEFTDKVLKTISSFLNSNEGGKIYIGIKDNGNIVGINDVDELQLKIINTIRDNIVPSIMGLFDVVTEVHEEVTILVIIVASGNEKPYYINKYGMTSKGTYMRVGSSDNQMPNNIIEKLFASRVKNSLNNIKSPKNDLSFKQLKIYYEENHLTINNNFLKNLELVDEDGNYNYNAYLLSDENSISILVSEYEGTTKVNLKSSDEFGYCSLIKATNKVLDKLDVINVTHTKITGNAKRKQWNNIDKVALREAVINAIIHNDYRNEVPPRFEIFSDRIEITSIGGLPNEMTESEFFDGISNPRNKVLMRVFKDLKLVEQLGSGVARILDKYDKSIFVISKNYLKTIFVFESESFKIKDGGINGGINGGIKLGDKRLELIYSIIKQNPKIKANELLIIARKTYKDITLNMIEKAIKKLKDFGLIIYEGSKKTGGYYIK